MIRVPEPLIDVVEPVVKVIVEQGYDRTVPPGEPTPARLIPTLNPVTVAADLVNAVGEGVNNALALTGSVRRERSAEPTCSSPNQPKSSSPQALSANLTMPCAGTCRSLSRRGDSAVVGVIRYCGPSRTARSSPQRLGCRCRRR
jgi:hypothetical protein